MTDKKYDAFISYRHTELDKFVAINLHKKLESFKLPKGVTSSTGKKKIERVFRDQDELPLSSDLSAQINDALIVSDFLIVICTPRLPESEWCKREIETFIKLHGRDKILAVLAEGEPWESFPEALTKEEVEVTKPDGTKEIELHSVEPLAADVRGKSNREIKKKLDDAVLRIAAAIFDLGYDDLKQRHKERKMKRTMSVVSGIAAGLLLFSAVCLAMTFKIMVQSEMILDQNNEIKEQSNRISLMAQELEIKNQNLTEQYRETHINYAKATADSADSLMHKGRKLDALYALRRVMPSTIDDESMPYTAETQLALTNALEVYNEDSAFSTGVIYEADSNIVAYDVSSDGKYLAIVDTAGTIRVFDIKSGEMLYTATAWSSFSANFNRLIGFLDNETLLYNSHDGLIAHKIAENTEEKIVIPGSNDNLDVCIETFRYDKVFFAYDNNNIYIYNSDNLSLLYEYAIKDLPEQSEDLYLNSIECIKLSSNSEYIIFSQVDWAGRYSFYRIGLSDGNLKYLNELALGIDRFHYQILEVLVSDDSYYVADMLTDPDNVLDVDYTVYSFDSNSGNMDWKSPVNSPIHKMYKNIGGKNLFASYNNALYIIDSETGAIIGTNIDADNIIYFQSGSYPGDTADYITSSGRLKAYMGSMGFWGSDIYNSDYMAVSVYPTENGVLVQPEDNNYITQYYQRSSENTDDAQTNPIIDLTCQEISKEGELYLVVPIGSQTAEIYDTSTGEIAYIYPSSYDYFSLVDDGKNCIVAFGSGFEVFDFVSKKAVCAAPSDYFFKSNAISCDKKYILGQNLNNKEYAVFSLLTGEKVSVFKLDEDISPDSIVLINKDTYAMVEYGNKMKFYKIGDSKPIFESPISLSKNDQILKCAYNDVLCVSFENNCFEIYSIEDDSVKLMKSFYSMNYNYFSDSSMIYYPEKNIYVLSESKYDATYVFNSDCEIIAFLPRSAFFIESENRFISHDASDDCYSSPFYSYEELIKMADEILGDYHPSQRIAAQFNIK